MINIRSISLITIVFCLTCFIVSCGKEKPVEVLKPDFINSYTNPLTSFKIEIDVKFKEGKIFKSFPNDSEKKLISDLLGYRLEADPKTTPDLIAAINTSKTSYLLYVHGHGHLNVGLTGTGDDTESAIDQASYGAAEFEGPSINGKVMPATALTPPATYSFVFFNCCFSMMDGREKFIDVFTGKHPEYPDWKTTYMGWPWLSPQAGSMVFANKFFEYCDKGATIEEARKNAWFYCKYIVEDPPLLGIAASTIEPSIDGYLDMVIDWTP